MEMIPRPYKRTIQWKIAKISEMTNEVCCSPIHVIANKIWRLSACVEPIEYHKYLSINLHCYANNRNIEWSCDVDVEFRLIFEFSNTSSYKRRTMRCTYNADNCRCGIAKFVEMSELANPTNGRLLNDSVIVEARISFKKTPWIIRNISNLTSNGFKSAPYYFGDIRFQFEAARERADDEDYLSMYLIFNEDNKSNIWSCRICYEFRLVSQNPIDDEYDAPLTIGGIETFSSRQPCWGCKLKWDNVMNPANGCILNDSLIIESRFFILMTDGLLIFPSFDTYRSSEYSIVTINVQNHIFRLDKSLLGAISPVFRDMFLDENEIQLDDINYRDFFFLVNAIFSCYFQLHEFHVNCLLKLADKFKIDYIKFECEQFLKHPNRLSIGDMLKLAEDHRLAAIQNLCMQSLTSSDEIEEIRESYEYKYLGNETREILDRKLNEFDKF
ncbi:unnamed protein product [Caenorhabditis bovis]|uniref:BTB domain-containing protein n=1 Tax=Caenorhabditis bovis TaxID=2654633 RepID=A0A8S1EYL7_9PELO|nr:unnamed protein product [Caenorhabditis bovis]